MTHIWNNLRQVNIVIDFLWTFCNMQKKTFKMMSFSQVVLSLKIMMWCVLLFTNVKKIYRMRRYVSGPLYGMYHWLQGTWLQVVMDWKTLVVIFRLSLMTKRVMQLCRVYDVYLQDIHVCSNLCKLVMKSNYC